MPADEHAAAAAVPNPAYSRACCCRCLQTPCCANLQTAPTQGFCPTQCFCTRHLLKASCMPTANSSLLTQQQHGAHLPPCMLRSAPPPQSHTCLLLGPILSRQCLLHFKKLTHLPPYMLRSAPPPQSRTCLTGTAHASGQAEAAATAHTYEC
jgi:hypothetical protein